MVNKPYSDYLTIVAKRRGVSVEDLVQGWIKEKTDDIEGLPKQVSEKCLCPTCSNFVLSLGLCPRHYQRIRWFVKRKLLNEGWLMRHGRMLPRRGKTIEDYAISVETLETLPKVLPDDLPDTKWMFGWPEAASERSKLEGGAHAQL